MSVLKIILFVVMNIALPLLGQSISFGGFSSFSVTSDSFHNSSIFIGGFTSGCYNLTQIYEPSNGLNTAEDFSNCEERVFFEGAGIKVYPNPTKDKIVVSGIEESNQLLIFDNLGKEYHLRWVNHSENTLELDLSALSRGVYYLRSAKEIVKVIKL